MRIAGLALLMLAGAAHAERRGPIDLAPPHALETIGWRAVPGWLVGQRGAIGAIADAAIAERAARAMIAELALTGSTWEVTANRVDGGKRTVGFRQMWRGAPVVDGSLAFVIARDRIFAIATHAYVVSLGDAPAPGEVVLALAGGGFALARPQVDGSITRYLARDGRVLATRDARRSATGTLLYDVSTRYPTGARHAAPAPLANVTGDGAPLVSDAAGALAWSTAAPLAIAPTTTGPEVAVTSVLGASTIDLSLADGGTATWSAPATETTDAELSAFIHVSEGKVAARRFIPALAAWLATPLAVSVNATDATCNAFTDTDGLHFYRATATCENTGRLADVVYHEFGHAIHGQAVALGMGGATDGALGEGVADFNAANLTGDEGIGRGFHFTDAPDREIDPAGRDLRWPEDTHADADLHATGLIISGALWDLRTLAGQPVAETAFRGVLERATDIPSAYTAALVEDDDDASLANGTPHRCAIAEAFARHGLAPDHPTTLAGAAQIDPSTLAVYVPIATPATPDPACQPPTVTSATLHWHRDGDATITDLALSPSGTAGFQGQLPAQPDPTLVHFSIELALSNGLSIALPSNLADREYAIFTGTITPLYCAHMDVDPHWTLDGSWQYANPLASAPPDPTGPPTAGGAIGTNLAGTGLYANNATATATLPPVDPAGFAHVHLQFYRWLTVEDAAYDRASILANGTEVWANAEGGGTLDHADREWRFQDVDLSAQAAAGPIEVAFQLKTDSLGALGGWTLADVCVVGIGPGCGDGVVEVDRGEECDDGNRVDGDGCSATCTDELPAAPPPGCCETSPAPNAAAFALALLGLAWMRRRRSAHDAHH